MSEGLDMTNSDVKEDEKNLSLNGEENNRMQLYGVYLYERLISQSTRNQQWHLTRLWIPMWSIHPSIHGRLFGRMAGKTYSAAMLKAKRLLSSCEDNYCSKITGVVTIGWWQLPWAQGFIVSTCVDKSTSFFFLLYKTRKLMDYFNLYQCVRRLCSSKHENKILIKMPDRLPNVVRLTNFEMN